MKFLQNSKEITSTAVLLKRDSILGDFPWTFGNFRNGSGESAKHSPIYRKISREIIFFNQTQQALCMISHVWFYIFLNQSLAILKQHEIVFPQLILFRPCKVFHYVLQSSSRIKYKIKNFPLTMIFIFYVILTSRSSCSLVKLFLD